MIDSVNPFSSPEIRNAILAKEGMVGNANVDDEYETVDSQEDVIDSGSLSTGLDFKSIVSGAPKLPTTAKNLIMDASMMAKNERDAKAQEMNLALNNVFSEYNKQYGTDLQIDFSSLSNTLVNCADPQKRKTLELYVSEVVKSTRVVLLLHLISKLSLALDYILQPERMFDQSQLSLPDMFLVVEKLQQYIVNLNDIVDSSTVKDSDSLLKKMAEDRNDSSLDSEESRKAVDDFMKLFNNEILNK